jgi:hypothetical protein
MKIHVIHIFNFVDEEIKKLGMASLLPAYQYVCAAVKKL